MNGYDLVSVIIPVYNAAEYLARCLDSIINQTYTNYEIILIDDSSLDNSYEICLKYACIDDRIKVYKQDHGGAARARKNGVSKVRGENLLFIDADDYVEPKLIENLIQHKEADLVSSNIWIHMEDGEVIKQESKISAGDYVSDKDLKFFIENMVLFGDTDEYGLLVSMSGKLFKRNITVDVFDMIDLDISYGEDRDFIYKYALKCNYIHMIDEALYHYDFRSNSSTKTFDPEFFIDANRLRITLSETFNNSRYSEILLAKLKKQMKQVYLFGLDFKLGYEESCKIIYIPRYIDKNCKKVAVYGAGIVGYHFIQYLKMIDELSIVHWVDANKYGQEECGICIEEPSSLKRNDFDIVFLALSKLSIREQVKEYLIKMGVPINKISNDAPVKLP